MLKINTENNTDQLNSLIAELQNWLEPDELFDGLSNQDILNFHYDEKVYQFNSPISDYDLKINFNNKGHVLATFRNGKNFELGTIDPSKLIYKDTVVPRLVIRGGRYKAVAVNKDGSDHIKSFREPYKLFIDFYDKIPQHPSNSAQQALDQLQAEQRALQTLRNNEVSGLAVGCLIIIVIIILIPLMLFIHGASETF